MEKKVFHHSLEFLNNRKSTNLKVIAGVLSFFTIIILLLHLNGGLGVLFRPILGSLVFVFILLLIINKAAMTALKNSEFIINKDSITEDKGDGKKTVPFHSITNLDIKKNGANNVYKIKIYSTRYNLDIKLLNEMDEFLDLLVKGIAASRKEHGNR